MTNFVFRVVANVVNSAAWAANGLLEVMYPKDLYVPAFSVASGGPAAPCADPHPAGAADPAGGTPPPPAGSLTWAGWSLPAVLESLAEHRFMGRGEFDPDGSCSCGFHPANLYDWHEHLAPIITNRIACDPAKAVAALRTLIRSEWVETGHDMGLSHACEFFPQHTKPKK